MTDIQPGKLNPLKKPKGTESKGNKPVRIFGRNHLKCVTDQILLSWGNESYSDVTFLCKSSSGSSSNKCLRANKAVLAAGSRKLQLLLADTGDEDVHIIVPDGDFQTTKLLLQYIYTGKVLVGQERELLESLIYEWEIGYPEISPVESGSSTLAEITETALRFSFENIESAPKEVIVIEEDEGGSAIRKENVPEIPSVELTTPKKQTVTKRKAVEKEPDGPYVYPIASAEQIITHEKAVPDFLEEHDPLSTDGFFGAADCTTSSIEDLFADETSKAKDTAETPTVNDHGYVKINKKKVITNSDVAVPDTKEDEADFLLSKAFLKHERSRTEELTEATKELIEAIERHQLYVKHFIGAQNLPPKPSRLENLKYGPRIPCPTCAKLIRPQYLSRHLKTTHADERPFLCEQCGTSFPLADQLKTHIKTAHSSKLLEKKHICEVCGRAHRTKQHLKSHMTVHTGEKPYQCKYCDKRFRLNSVLSKHERTHTGEKPYLCSICGLRFATHSTCAVHLKTHSRALESHRRRGIQSKIFDEQFKCDTCGLTFIRENAFLMHEAAHTGEEPKLPCRHCPGTFPTMVLLKEHIKNNHSDALFSCDQCNNFYSSKWGLDNHKKTHKGLGSFPCSICQKEFEYKYKLAHHMKNVHSTERPFKCRFCTKEFKEKRQLVEHDRLHTGERPFRCPHCPKAFRVQVQLTVHLRTHTGEKPYSCSYCDKTFTSRERLRVHTKIHTGDQIRCSTCSKIFPSHAKLRVHERTHSEEVVEEREEDEEDDISDYMSEGDEETN